MMPLVASGDPVGCVARLRRLRSGRYRGCIGHEDNAARRWLGAAQRSMHWSGPSWGPRGWELWLLGRVPALLLRPQGVTPCHGRGGLVSTQARLAPSLVPETNVSPVFFDRTTVASIWARPARSPRSTLLYTGRPEHAWCYHCWLVTGASPAPGGCGCAVSLPGPLALAEQSRADVLGEWFRRASRPCPVSRTRATSRSWSTRRISGLIMNLTRISSS
jgi:hypothetical protein